MRAHHYINPDGTCHAGDLMEQGFPAKEVFIEDDIPTLLHQYSEWLDGEGVIRSEAETDDHRSHDDLVTAFLEREKR
jgi:hypothetical protein